jgi:hypothetical protein
LYCCSLFFGGFIIVLCLLFAACCSLSFGHCMVVLCLLVAVLFLFVFWSLYCCSLSFGR